MKIINLSNLDTKIERRKGIMIARRRFIAFGTKANVRKGLRRMRILGSKKEVGVRRDE